MGNKRINFGGFTWEKDHHNYDDSYSANIDNRFIATTWKFGSIHQAKVFIDYNFLIKGERKYSPFINHSDVGICLRPGKSMHEAMQICLDWISNYQQNGPSSPETILNKIWEHWTSFPKHNKPAVLDQLFFVGGGGYTWLDGALVEENPDDYLIIKNREQEDPSLFKALEACKRADELIKEIAIRNGEVPEDDMDTAKEKWWSCELYHFYRINDYSNISNIPDDIKPEWLDLAYEAATLLRDKSGLPSYQSKWYKNSPQSEEDQKYNRQRGAEIVKELEERFGKINKD